MQSSESPEPRILSLADAGSFAAVVERAARVIDAGEVIVYPTETVYGIGVDAWNSDALNRIPIVKGRDEQKPILVLVDAPGEVGKFAAEVTDIARDLMRAFWPGPLTLVVRARDEVPVLLTGGTGTIGLRSSPDPFCHALIKKLGYAITSTSANRAGQPTPETVEEIARQFGEAVALYIDAGALRGRVPSTVVDVSSPHPRLLREGAIRRSELLPFLQRG